jgi:hypothetical protein
LPSGETYVAPLEGTACGSVTIVESYGSVHIAKGNSDTFGVKVAAIVHVDAVMSKA